MAWETGTNCVDKDLQQDTWARWWYLFRILHNQRSPLIQQQINSNWACVLKFKCVFPLSSPVHMKWSTCRLYFTYNSVRPSVSFKCGSCMISVAWQGVRFIYTQKTIQFTNHKDKERWTKGQRQMTRQSDELNTIRTLLWQNKQNQNVP